MDIILDNEDTSFLIKVIQDALYSHLTNNALPVYYKTKELYHQKYGLFIKTVLNNITSSYGGIIQPHKTLIETVQACIIQSCFYDTRFKPITKDELDKVNIYVALIKSMELVTDKRMINLAEHGLMVEFSWHQGILLPWDMNNFTLSVDEYVKETALKAGISDLEHLLIKRINLITFHENK